MAKIAVFYYTQSGQGLEILQSVCRPLTARGYVVVFREIVPQTPYPFPWTARSFFQAFPESREGIPCPIEAPDFSGVEDAGLVILGYQPWYLSSSIPVSSFLQDASVQSYLRGKAVVTVCGCRNMWVQAQRQIRQRLAACGARLVGNIVLQDPRPNLISLSTIVRWLIGGQKERSKWLPAAGVSASDIRHAAVFGETIAAALPSGDFSALQACLMEQGAIRYKADIAFVEKVGYRMFGLWSKLVLKKGAADSPARQCRLNVFMYYLFAVLYVVSPVVLLFFYLAWPLRCVATKKDKVRQCYQLN